MSSPRSTRGALSHTRDKPTKTPRASALDCTRLDAALLLAGGDRTQPAARRPWRGSDRTIDIYLSQVARLARHFDRSPDCHPSFPPAPSAFAGKATARQVGVDLGDKRHAVCVLSQSDGEIPEEFPVPSSTSSPCASPRRASPWRLGPTGHGSAVCFRRRSFSPESPTRSQHLPRREFNPPRPFNLQPPVEASPWGRCEATSLQSRPRPRTIRSVSRYARPARRRRSGPDRSRRAAPDCLPCET